MLGKYIKLISKEIDLDKIMGTTIDTEDKNVMTALNIIKGEMKGSSTANIELIKHSNLHAETIEKGKIFKTY